MKGYTFDLSCPGCGGDLEHVNAGRVVGGEASAIAGCPSCRCSFSIHVDVVRLGAHVWAPGELAMAQ